MDSPEERTASLMTPAKLARAGAARAPVSPAAWLDKMASEAGHMHIARLVELQADLGAQAPAQSDATVLGALKALDHALLAMDFALLQPRGWWARATGKGRGAGAEFSQQFQAADAAAGALAAQVQALHKHPSAQAGSSDRTLLEFEIEVRAIDKIIDQGARWLQDMRNQIKARLAQDAGPAAQQQARADAARCDILVARLKSLRAAASAAQAVHQQVQAQAARRAAWSQLLAAVVGSELKPWRARMSALCAAAGEGKPPALDASVERQRELQQRVQQAQADAVQLRAHDQALARALSALGDQLAATS